MVMRGSGGHTPLAQTAYLGGAELVFLGTRLRTGFLCFLQEAYINLLPEEF